MHGFRSLVIAGNVNHKGTVRIVGPVLDYGARYSAAVRFEQTTGQGALRHIYGFLWGTLNKSLPRFESDAVIFRILMLHNHGADFVAGFECTLRQLHPLEWGSYVKRTGLSAGSEDFVEAIQRIGGNCPFAPFRIG